MPHSAAVKGALARDHVEIINERCFALAVDVYIVKRPLSKQGRNGKHKFKLVLRWRDPSTQKWRCESTGTADMIEAREYQRLKWAELNRLVEPAVPTAPAPVIAKPSWHECFDALRRAMTADNSRSSYVDDGIRLLQSIQRLFPQLVSPANMTVALANEYKRRRAEGNPKQGIEPVSPWTLRGDIATLKAVFGKWLGRECGLLNENPFANVRPPKCDDPDVRIVTAEETAELFAWFSKRWNNWRLPLVYLEVAALLGWRATEIASLRFDDVLDDGFVRVQGKSSKTRKMKYGWLPASLHLELRGCSQEGWAFGRFADELRRLLLLWRKRPNHAAKVKPFSPGRMVGWLQDELQLYNEVRAAELRKTDSARKWEPFTLHDFRRTAITGMQMAGVSEKEASIMVGATPEVIRKHYEKMDRMAIAKRSVERRLGADFGHPSAPGFARPLRAEGFSGLDDDGASPQTVSA